MHFFCLADLLEGISLGVYTMRRRWIFTSFISVLICTPVLSNAASIPRDHAPVEAHQSLVGKSSFYLLLAAAAAAIVVIALDGDDNTLPAST